MMNDENKQNEIKFPWKNVKNRTNQTLAKEDLEKMAKEHLKGKARAIEIMKDEGIPMETREAMVLEIVKHEIWLPVIKLMAGIK